jgi:predicted aspartyl protease
MGTFSVTLSVGDLGGNQYIPVDALVDTRASHCMFPTSMLQNLGLEPTDRGAFRLADEHMRTFDIGAARLRLEGREKIVDVIFGDEGTQPLLGAIALETFRLAVDPLGKRLIDAPGVLMQFGPEP